MVTALADLPQFKDRVVDNEQIEDIVEMEMPQHIADAEYEMNELATMVKKMRPEKRGPSLGARMREALGVAPDTDLVDAMEIAILRLGKISILREACTEAALACSRPGPLCDKLNRALVITGGR